MIKTRKRTKKKSQNTKPSRFEWRSNEFNLANNHWRNRFVHFHTKKNPFGRKLKSVNTKQSKPFDSTANSKQNIVCSVDIKCSRASFDAMIFIAVC